MAAKFLYAVLIGLVGAGIVHAAILLLLPDFAQKDAWSRLAAAGTLYSFVRIDDAERPIINSIDPLFEAAACRFNLADGVVHVKAPGRVPFWSVSVYNRRDQNIYSLNDRAATNHDLDLVILTPAQMIEVRKDIPAEFDKSVFVEVDARRGVAAIRSFVPEPSWSEAVSNFLDKATCELR